MSSPNCFVSADPSHPHQAATRFCPQLAQSPTEVTVAGSHFIQEDSPHQIGRAIADWLDTIG